jgi:hypothetical protein
MNAFVEEGLFEMDEDILIRNASVAAQKEPIPSVCNKLKRIYHNHKYSKAPMNKPLLEPKERIVGF